MERTEVDRAYLAGFIDADGAIMLRSCRKGYIVLGVSIANTNVDVLQKLQHLWGGQIYTEIPRCSHHKPVHKLKFSGRASIGVLQEIGSYMRLKQKQCQLALRFAETIGTTGKPLTTATVNARIDMQIAMKALNYRGVPASIGAE